MARKTTKKNTGSLSLFQKISLLFFDRPRVTAVIFLIIFAFGVGSYTTFLKREGFPDVQVPISFVSGAYLVNDSAKVDSEVSKPLSDLILERDDVKRVNAQSGANFFTVVVDYEEGTDAAAANAAIEKTARDSNLLPEQAKAEFKPLSFGITERGDDLLIAFYDKDNDSDLPTLVSKAEQAAKFLKDEAGIPLADSISILDPYVRGTNPTTGQSETSQKTFDRLGIKSENQAQQLYVSTNIGVTGIKGFDVLQLDEQVRTAIEKLNKNPEFAGFGAELTFSEAPSINDQIQNLQTALLEGLVAVIIISAILIAFRAAAVIVISMILVLTITLGVLYLIGYSLNTITLFSLVLSLSLIVDDTIIMVEAIDAQRRRSKKARDVVERATKKISRAMLAATLTATIGFAPLIFVSGVLGLFIRAIPVTVILSLLISFIIALTFIPFLSRYFLLRKNQLGHDDEDAVSAHGLEVRLARQIARPMLWAQHHRRRLWGLGVTALIIGFGFIFASGVLFRHISFNIFAPSKDSDALLVRMTFPPNQTINQVEDTVDKAILVTESTLKDNYKQIALNNTASTQQATLYIDLKSFKEREPRSPELITELENAFKSFDAAQVTVSQQDAGPPAGAFTVRIETDNREAAFSLAKEVASFLEDAQLKRPDGTTAELESVNVSNPNVVNRFDGRQFVSVTAAFSDTDTSTLVLLAQDAVKKEFTKDRTSPYGLEPKNLTFDFGSEGDNQDSFKTLLIALPILLIAIYALLILQFRSFLQPALIFMAIPFSLFGITAALLVTDNAFSFFTMLGFFALIGLSIKNTILLTDYANQEQRAGATPVEAIAEALQERFRPLIATSLTAIVSLIPLILGNPFWEGLGVTLIFGLLSSTLLVILIFPYYYLGAEYLRLKISRIAFAQWISPVIAVGYLLIQLESGKFIPLFAVVWLVAVIMYRRKLRHNRA